MARCRLRRAGRRRDVRAEARRLELARLDAIELVAAADLARRPLVRGRGGRARRRRRRRRPRAVVGDPRAGARPRRTRRRGPAGGAPGRRRAGARPASARARPARRRGRGARGDAGRAPSAAPARPSARPRAPLTPTVGRSTELARVLLALDDARLVTIVGPGGVGKTRWPSTSPAPAPVRHARGALVVELARVDDAAGVVSTIAAALDLRPPPGGGARRAERPRVARRPARARQLRARHRRRRVGRSPMLARRRPAAGAGDEPRAAGHRRRARAARSTRSPTDGADAPAVELFRQRAVAAAPTGTLDADLVAEVVVAPRRAAAGAGDGRRPPAHDDAGRAGRARSVTTSTCWPRPAATSTSGTARCATSWPGRSGCSTTSCATRCTTSPCSPVRSALATSRR